MQDNLLIFQDPTNRGTAIGDVAPTAGAYVKRDVDGSVNVGPGNVSSLNNSGATVNAPAAAMAANGTVPSGVTLQPLDATSAAFTATLPLASVSLGQSILFTKIDSGANVPTIAASGSDTIISTAGSATTYTGLTAQASAVLLVCQKSHAGAAQWWALKFS